MDGRVHMETAASRVERQGKPSETLGASCVAVCANYPSSEVYSPSVGSFFFFLISIGI